MEVSAVGSLITPAGTVGFNAAGDWLQLTRLDGFDDPELRVTVDLRSGQPGAIVHSILDGALYGTVEGWILYSTAAQRNSHEAFLRACLKSIQAADGTFTVTETGQAARSLTVRRNSPLQTAIVQGIVHSVQFALVAADPAWS